MTARRQFESLKSGWYVWLFPLIAILVSGWLLVDYFNQKGPTIRIAFEDASSIQADKTKVRFRGVTIGSVSKIAISSDNREVIAFVALNRDNGHFAVEGSKFWVVTPKVNLQGVSGLETLFEGNYIAAQPGPSEGPPQFDFKGTIGSDTGDSVEGTLSYILETDNLGSVATGDNVTFRGMPVGTVTRVSLTKTAQQVMVQINIPLKYTKLVRTNTVFWRKVGIQADLGLLHSEVKIGSLDTLLHGGIDFFTPDNAGEPAKAQTHFVLYSSAPKGYEKWSAKLD